MTGVQTCALPISDPALRVGGTLIVNGPPCFGCAKQIASSGISRVVFSPDASYQDWNTVKTFLENCGIKLIEVKLEEIQNA